MNNENYRCLFVAHDGRSEIGGVHTWLGTLMPMLRERGVDCSAAIFLRDGEGSLTHQLRRSKIKVSTYSHFEPFRHRVRWLMKVIEENQVKVIVPNYLVAGFAAATSLRVSGVRSIAALHSDDPFYDALIECQRMSDPVVNFDHVVPVSRFLEEKVRERLGKDFPTTRVPYGIVQKLDKSSPSTGEFRLVYVGRLVQEQKRIRDLAAAFCRAVREIPGVTADIIGDGGERKAVEEVLRANGNPREVRLLGALTPTEVRQRLPQYHAKVLLSDYEGLPVALLEAMASGLVPVCTSMRSGINELVIDDVTGLIVADRGDDFVSAIRRLAQNPSFWSSLSMRAREQVKAFDAEICAAKWVDVINQVARMKVAEPIVQKIDRLQLPKWRPEFDWDMQREPSRFSWLLQKFRNRLGRLRRKIFQNHSIHT